MISSTSLINNQYDLTVNIETAKLEKDNIDVAQLISLCCSDNKDAWDTFIGRFHRYITLYVVRQTRNYKLKDTDVAEIVQEVFLKLLANNRHVLKEFRGNTQTSFLAYLATIVHTVVLDIVRKEFAEKRSVPTISLDSPVDDENTSLADILPSNRDVCPTLAISKKVFTQKIKQLLKANKSGKNTVRDIKIFWLYAVYGFSAREIAELPTFSLTTSNVQAIVLRTKEKLYQVVKHQLMPNINSF